MIYKNTSNSGVLNKMVVLFSHKQIYLNMYHIRCSALLIMNNFHNYLFSMIFLVKSVFVDLARII